MHVMIDIETLGTKPGSVIASIGAVEFDPASGRLGGELEITVDIENAQSLGLTIDAKTVAWWLNQNDTARKALFGGGIPLSSALIRLGDFLSIWKDVRVWSHGACFDLVLIESACLACHLPFPWPYNAHRDTRTIYDIAGINPKDFQEGTAHNALDDAKAQARAVIAAYKALGKGVA